MGLRRSGGRTEEQANGRRPNGANVVGGSKRYLGVLEDEHEKKLEVAKLEKNWHPELL